MLCEICNLSEVENKSINPYIADVYNKEIDQYICNDYYA
jgi:hypothetical protein